MKKSRKLHRDDNTSLTYFLNTEELVDEVDSVSRSRLPAEELEAIGMFSLSDFCREEN